VHGMIVLNAFDAGDRTSFLSALPSPSSSVKMKTFGADETMTFLPSTQMPARY